MKNENENNGKSVEKMAEELIDKVIAKMEESGATIDGLNRGDDAIEKRKEQQARRRQKADMNRRYVDIVTEAMKGGMK